MILLVSPGGPASDSGNGVTARRWAGICRDLGHRVQIDRRYDGRPYHALIALHARKSADAVRSFRAEHPRAPVVLALTGTDLYPDLTTAGVDPAVLQMADRIVVLQPAALAQLPPDARARTRVIVQSMPAIQPRPPRTDCFEVAFLAHMRPVKDPLRPAAAAQLLPAGSRIRITHAGAAHDKASASDAIVAAACNPRYDWVGPLPRSQALDVLARSRLLVNTSYHEGGANVISEALAAGVPVVCSRIPGSVGLLGATYPGYFPAGDTRALAGTLLAAEQDAAFYRELTRACAALRPLVDPLRERQQWQSLLAELELSVTV